MADALHIHLFQQSQNALHIDAGGSQQGFQDGFAAQGLAGLLQVRIVLHIEDLPHQTEAVGVYAGAGQGNDHITGPHPGIVDDLLLIHNSHAEACQIVVIHGHHAGMLRRLTADEGGTGLDAALGHTAYDFRNTLRHILAAGNVIQEKQRLCAAADYVIDAHGHTVDADGIVLVQEHGDFQLGTHAVGTGNQNGLLHTGDGQAEAAAEAAHIVQAPFIPGPGNVLLHEFHGLVTGSDVYTGSGVAGRLRILVIHR